MPTVSFIVPFKNGKKYIRNCIDNLKKQKYHDFEIILIDDSSIDNSEKELIEYREDKNIKYYYLEDNTIGVGKARNYGVDKANGKYIVFIDVDDYIEEDLLLKLHLFLERNIDLIKYKMRIINGEKISKEEGPTFDIVTGEDAFNRLCFNDNFFDSPCLYAIKKEYFKNSGLKFEENMYHEDFGTIPLLIANAKNVVSTDVFGYRYMQTNNSIMRDKDYSKTLIKVKNKFEHYTNMIKIVKAMNLKKKTEENVREYYTNSVIMSLKNLKKKDRIFFEDKIKQMQMFDNFKVNNLKKLIKKTVLKNNIELYLKLKGI